MPKIKKEKMVRQQVLIRPDQKQLLLDKKAEEGGDVSKLVRTAIDETYGKEPLA